MKQNRRSEKSQAKPPTEERLIQILAMMKTDHGSEYFSEIEMNAVSNFLGCENSYDAIYSELESKYGDLFERI